MVNFFKKLFSSKKEQTNEVSTLIKDLISSVQNESQHWDFNGISIMDAVFCYQGREIIKIRSYALSSWDVLIYDHKWFILCDADRDALLSVLQQFVLLKKNKTLSKTFAQLLS